MPIHSLDRSMRFILLLALFSTIISAALAFGLYRAHVQTVELRSHVARLEAELRSNEFKSRASINKLERRLLDSEARLRAEAAKAVNAAMPSFVEHASQTLATRTLPELRVLRLAIVDGANRERITLGTGVSPFSLEPNSYIRVVGPAGTYPVLLSATDKSSSVSVDARSFLSAGDGISLVALYRSRYKLGMAPTVAMASTKAVNGIDILDENSAQRINLVATSGETSLVIRDQAGKVRAGFGALPNGSVATFVKNKRGEVVYGIHSSDSPYAESFLRESPASRAWTAASAFSTLKTFFDVFVRR